MYSKFYLLIFSIILISCSNKKESKLKKGEELARYYCGSCHQFPDPSLLSKKVWTNKVLPNMATRMGFKWGFPYQGLDAAEVKELLNKTVFPDQPIISEEMMLRIVKYYENNAPEKPFEQQKKQIPDTNLQLFSLKNNRNKVISTQNILVKNFPQKHFLIKSFEDKGTWRIEAPNEVAQKISDIPAADALVFNEKLYLLNIINTKPSNLPKGGIFGYDFKNKSQKLVLDSLIRPVNMDIADLNGDQKPDFIVCEFGDYLGQLSLHLSNGNEFKKVILKNYPGACKVKFEDINRDGKLDIVAAMSQANEELIIFFNKGNNDFYEKSIAKYPPSFGLNNMQVVDIDNNSLMDILVTNGDNADISSQLKNYHGIRIYKNLGGNNFKQSWFYPMHGASNLVVADFDKDNKMDFAVIAHFPDFKNVEREDFVFFKNLGINKYKPFKFKNPFNGRLLTIEKIDIDNDTDEDIILGNYIDNLTDPGVNIYTSWMKNKKEYWVLENKRFRKK